MSDDSRDKLQPAAGGAIQAFQDATQEPACYHQAPVASPPSASETDQRLNADTHVLLSNVDANCADAPASYTPRPDPDAAQQMNVDPATTTCSHEHEHRLVSTEDARDDTQTSAERDVTAESPCQLQADTQIELLLSAMPRTTCSDPRPGLGGVAEHSREQNSAPEPILDEQCRNEVSSTTTGEVKDVDIKCPTSKAEGDPSKPGDGCVSVISKEGEPSPQTTVTQAEEIGTNGQKRSFEDETLKPETPDMSASEHTDPNGQQQTSAQVSQASETPGQKPPTTTSISSTKGSKLQKTSTTTQEATLADLKAQRAALLANLAKLPEIQKLATEKSDSASDEAGIVAAANTVVKRHITLLHEYNEIKDVGQGLMGLIAEQRGVRIVEVQDDFGIGPKD